MPARPKSDDWRDIALEIGRRVRLRREVLELSQEELAHLAGIHRNQLQNIEQSRNNVRDADGTRGPANPTLDTIYLLAVALEVDVHELLPARPGRARVSRQA